MAERKIANHRHVRENGVSRVNLFEEFEDTYRAIDATIAGIRKNDQIRSYTSTTRNNAYLLNDGCKSALLLKSIALAATKQFVKKARKNESIQNDTQKLVTTTCLRLCRAAI